MRSATARALALGLLLVAGCKPDPTRPDAGPLVWSPKPGEIVDWDVQLAASPFDVSAPRAMYVIDLFDAVPAPTTLDYGAGVTVTVPAGAHASAIAQLRAMSPAPVVVCHVNTGTIRLSDPDAMKFPGYEAAPPNDPTPPKPESVIGWSSDLPDANERWINTNSDVRGKVLPLIGRRLDLAKQIGCDAIAANRFAAGSPGKTGFADILPSAHTSWVNALRDEAHRLLLSIGVWNSAQQVLDADAAAFDWSIFESCGERDECDMLRPFLEKHKAVFALEYTTDSNGDPNTVARVCGNQANAGITGGILKSRALDNSSYMRCP